MPKSGNATYSTSGELSTLLNDPELRTIGIGTRIFLGGAQGYVSWNGTQFNTSVPKNTSGIPKSNSATIAVIGDLKKMHTDFIKAGYFEKYGVSIFIGIGIPISLLDEEMAVFVSVKNEQIETTVFDYGTPERTNMGTAIKRQKITFPVIIPVGVSFHLIFRDFTMPFMPMCMR
ncbi:hypothetical protein ES705_49918 [subsurface metagenome]